ncbi:MAG: UDP-N-acetylmuramate dehydrogenase [Dehalococcoidia bacterium]|nr:MAG: UDP-N-acetylmuramate dehydrogenase [Dehalococcoidia bacterium]
MLPRGGTVLQSVNQAELHAKLISLQGGVIFDEPLFLHTTLAIGGRATCFFLPTTIGILQEAISLCNEYEFAYMILGAGSNVIFPDKGYLGMVIGTSQLRGASIGDGWVHALAGEPLAELITRLDQANQQSLNFLAGIPGSLGGAIAMNAGIPERAIGQEVEQVAILNSATKIKVIPAKDCGFSYRTSLFVKNKLPILWAKMNLNGKVYDRIEILNRRRLSQPSSAYSAGCVFKNPPGLSAGRLIEQAGLKGFRVGMAKVSEKHANFIINCGGATSAQVLELIDIIRRKVYKSSHIQLEMELEVIGE